MKKEIYFFKKRYTLKFDVNNFENACKTEFWDKPSQKEQLEQYSREMDEDAIKNFVDDMKYYDDIYDIRLVSDFNEFDIGWVNYYLCKEGFYPVNYVNQKFKRITIHTSSYYRCVRDNADETKSNTNNAWGCEDYVKELFQMKPIEGILINVINLKMIRKYVIDFLKIEAMNIGEVIYIYCSQNNKYYF